MRPEATVFGWLRRLRTHRQATPCCAHCQNTAPALIEFSVSNQPDPAVIVKAIQDYARRNGGSSGMRVL